MKGLGVDSQLPSETQHVTQLIFQMPATVREFQPPIVTLNLQTKRK